MLFLHVWNAQQFPKNNSNDSRYSKRFLILYLECLLRCVLYIPLLQWLGAHSVMHEAPHFPRGTASAHLKYTHLKRIKLYTDEGMQFSIVIYSTGSFYSTLYCHTHIFKQSNTLNSCHKSYSAISASVRCG